MVELLENEVYTSDEIKSILKISQSTFLRLVKKGIISAYKIGGQYRILGKEILSLFNPQIQEKAIHAYRGVKNKIKSIVDEEVPRNGKNE